MSKGVFKFGAYLLDGEKLKLTREGEVIAAHPKVIETLLALVEQHGQVVSKEDLMNRLWPDTFVEEANLKQNIYVLRRTLGEERGQPRYIETVPKRGYRFVAEVQELNGARIAPDPVAAPAVPNLNEAASPTRRSQSRRNLFVALAVVIVVVSGWWFYFQRSPAPPGLTDKDTILLADFENKTGEEIFDGMLKQGLAIQLQQTPFLTLLPEAQARRQLTLMKRAPNERVTVELAREICLRENLKAFITGSLATLGSHYVVTLTAYNGQNGAELAGAQQQAATKEEVLRALAQAATGLRENLGESLSSIQRFNVLLQEGSTTKPEAFKAYAQALELAVGGRLREAIPFYQRAVELDPNFAHAYSQLAIMYSLQGQTKLAVAAAQKSYALQDQAGELEKFRITHWYQRLVTGDLHKAVETLRLQRSTYPSEYTGPNDLALTLSLLGQHDEALQEARAAIRLNPDFAAPYVYLAVSLIRFNRFAEAKEWLTAALGRGITPTPLMSSNLYQLAVLDGDAAGMQQQLDRLRGKPEEHLAWDWQAQTAAYAGQWRQAREFAHRAIEMTARGDTTEVAARYAAEQSLRGAVLGDCRQARVDAAQGLKLTRARISLTRAALAYALCGEANQAKLLADELSRRYPEDTIINSIWLPVIRAALELQRGNAEQAIERLQPAARYEAAAEFWPQYLRGQAYLQLKRGAEAVMECQKILAHRGHAPLSPLYPLAHLGLARAALLNGETDKARQAYASWQELWREADADLPVLLAAQKEGRYGE